MESRLGGWAPMVCMSYLGVHTERAWVGGEAENESVLKIMQLRRLCSIQAVKSSSGWKGESAMRGADLYWRYRGGSHWLVRKMKLWGWTWRAYAVEREPRSDFWEASEFMRTLPKSWLMTSLRRGGGVGAVGEVRNILALLLGLVVCGAEGCKGRAGLWKAGGWGWGWRKKELSQRWGLQEEEGKGVQRGEHSEGFRRFVVARGCWTESWVTKGTIEGAWGRGRSHSREAPHVVHMCNGVLLGHHKEWNNAICSNMDGPRDDHVEWNKSERERQLSYDVSYVESKKVGKSLSCVWLSVTTWTVVHRLLCPWDSPDKNTGGGKPFPSPADLPTPQRLNLGLLHCRQILYHLNHQGSPCGIQNMIQMNLFTNQEQTHRHCKQIYGYRRGEGGGGIN